MESYGSVSKKVGIVGIITNFILLVIKLMAGIIFKSEALIADGANSLGDVFSSMITYIGGKISLKPADSDHEFGHGKAEFVASFLIGIFMIMVSFETLNKSIMSIIQNEKIIFSYLLILVPLITIVIKIILFIYCNNKYKRYSSLLFKSNRDDHRNDILLSIGVIIGIVSSYFEYYFVDGIIGIIISIVIFISGIKITKSAYEVLIDKCIEADKVNEMKKIISEVSGVKHIDSIKSKPTGIHHIIIVKVSVSPDMTVRDSHKIAGVIREKIRNMDNIYDVVVHINPDEK